MVTKTKWTNELVEKVVVECREAGAVSAAAKLAELSKAGSQYGVMAGGVQVGVMLDVCGFANVKLKSAKGKFFQLAKKLCKESPELRFNCDNHYYGGGHFNVYDCHRRQEMSVNVAASQGMADVLSGYGIECSVEGHID